MPAQLPIEPGTAPALRALGGLVLDLPTKADEPTNEDRALRDLAARRRKVALLLYLARQRRPVARDLLALMFWGEAAPERSRHNLTEALSHIRRAFGRTAIAARLQDVSLDADLRLTVDVVDFERACAQCDWAVALALYHGPFLSGVFVDRAPAFDDWASRERTHLHELFIEATIAEIRAATGRGDAPRIVELAERWLEEDVESEEAALVLLEALARPSTRDALRTAIGRYNRLRQRIFDEWDSEPSAAVQALATSLSQQLAKSSTTLSTTNTNSPLTATDATTTVADPEVELADARTPLDVERAPAAVTSPHALTAPASVAPSAAVVRKPHSARRWTAAAAAATAAVLMGIGTLWATRERTSPTQPWVVIADTDDPSNDEAFELSVTTTLRVALAQSDAFDVISARRQRDALRMMGRADTIAVDERTALDIAARLGAHLVVVPVVARLGAQRLLSARVVNVVDDRVLVTVQTRASDEAGLISAVDDLAKKLQRRLGAAASTAASVPPLPSVTTASLPALRSFARGIGYTRRQLDDSALKAYRQATDIDPSFAMAYIAMGELLYQWNEPAAGDSALRKALSLRARLSEREAMLTEASLARWRRDPDAAIAIVERWLVGHPRDRDARSTLAYDLLMSGRNGEAKEAYLRLLSVDSLQGDTWVNLAVVAGRLDTPTDRALTVAAYSRALLLAPRLRTDGIVNHQYGMALVRAGLPDSAESILRLMLSGTASQVARGRRSLGILAFGRSDWASAAREFDAAVVAHRAAGEVIGEVRSRLWQAAVFDATSNVAAARAQLDTVRTRSRGAVREPTMLYWAGKAMARQGMRAAAQEMLDTLRRRAVAENRQHLGEVTLLDGEVAALSARSSLDLDRIAQAAARAQSLVADETVAYLARVSGQAARADSLDQRLAASTEFGWEGVLAQRAAAGRMDASRLSNVGTSARRLPGR